MNVLILSGGGFQGQTILKELNVISGVESYVADIYPENTSKYFTANYVLLPPFHDASFSAQLKKFIAEKKIEVIIPSTAYELNTISRLKKEVSCKIAVSDPELITLFADKGKTYEYLRKNDLSVLPSLSAKDINEKHLPVIAKSVKGFGGKGITIIRTIHEWKQWSSANVSADFTIQSYLEDYVEYSADFAIDFSGQISNINLRTRLRQSGGFATVTELITDATLNKLVSNFAKCISRDGACGLFNVQVLKKQDEYYFSDVNPRMGTSAVVGEVHGNNLCAFLLKSVGLKHHYFIDERPKKTIRFLEEKHIPKRKQDIKAVIFDLDDTLFPQKKWIIGKLKLLREKADIDIPEGGWLAEGLKQLENGHRSDLLDQLIRVFHLPQELKSELIEEYRLLTPEVNLYNDVIPVLHRLKKDGIKTAVLTDNPPQSQQQKLKSTGLNELLDVIVFSRETGGEKPFIGAFQTVIDKLNVKPEECIYIGDHLYKDILGGYLAGIKTLFHLQRQGGFFNFDESEFRRLHPAIEFAAIRDLFDVVNYIND